MIVNIFMLLASAILAGITGILNLLQFTIPSEVATSITYFISDLQYGQSLWPIGETLLAMVFVLAVYFRMYVFRFVVWIVSYIPWIGGKGTMPSMPTAETLEYYAPEKIDLRQGRIRTKYRTMQDIKH